MMYIHYERGHVSVGLVIIPVGVKHKRQVCTIRIQYVNISLNACVDFCDRCIHSTLPLERYPIR